MSSALFTTVDGDVILRAGSQPDSKYDFRVHKFILSLASSVFKDMFSLPRPSDQNYTEQPDIPIVDISDSPKVFDTILRFIYPGVEPPEITNISILSALFSTADKYNITSINPILRRTLKTFLPDDSFKVFVIACQYGFLEEAKEAAKVSRSQNFVHLNDREDVRHISSTDLFRLVQFVHEREHEGQCKIQAEFDITKRQDYHTRCQHYWKAHDHYPHVEKAVQEAFVSDPCMGRGGLYAVLDLIFDSPPGCDYGYCPLRPSTIRGILSDIGDGLDSINDTLLGRYFGEDFGKG